MTSVPTTGWPAPAAFLDGGTPAPPNVIPLADVLDEALERIDALPAQTTLPANLVDHARDTLSGLISELRAPGAALQLLHYDLQFGNVLHTLPGGEQGWRAIDPRPAAGIREWEPIALLRNRWADARDSGDPDRAMRRRADQVSDLAGLDRVLVRRCAQAAAVDNVLTLQDGNLDGMFTPPFSVTTRWSAG